MVCSLFDQQLSEGKLRGNCGMSGSHKCGRCTSFFVTLHVNFLNVAECNSLSGKGHH